MSKIGQQICHIINNECSNLQEKGEAIKMVMSIETKNSISKDAAMEEMKNDLVESMAAYCQLNGIKALMELVMDAINTVRGGQK